ncbi:MAG: electron transport complex subunit RsxC, partial [Gammaproteobacteria bacterium]|nr:electron transport complex subunit RsxC [Gammaproteobacteria bacterium]
MQSLFQQIKAGQVWDFHGGIHPPARKQHTSHKPIGRMPLPERLYVPLRQHIGVAGSLLVVVGQQVLKGQPLTFADNAMAVPVHAPTSGTIIAIESHIAPHPSALPEPCVVIAPDGLDQWRDRLPMNLLESDRLTILQRIQEAGIAGMGGAGFPTHLKTGAAGGIDYLIVNAVECEPYISADDVLMQEFATTIVKGIDILCELLSPAAVLIGIEDDKPLAIAAMQAACSQRDNYLVKVVPAKYPSGGEKQLIQLLTSKEVPAGRRPLDIGIVMQNVGTVFAIAQAVLEDMPLISRIVTVVGDSLSQPQNVLALIGTPVGYLLDFCGFIPEPAQRVIMGGPMMGFTLPSVSVPVVKTSNCILAPTQTELPAANQEMDCIRCGACAEVCPAVLLPQQLLWYSKAKDQDKLKEYNLADCIECGACAYVCPSEIPLVHYYRVAKAEIREQTRDELKAEQAKARFEARNARLEQEKQQRAARNQALALQRQQLMAEQQKNREIEQAQQRVATANAPELADMSKEQIIALREQKKAEARAYQAQKAQQQSSSATGVSDSTATLSTTTEQAPAANKSADDSLDPRAAAVAAAIARAKAKKAQAEPATTAASNDAAPDQTPVEASPVQDPRAAAVAAAIARAKAKKAQAEPATT